MRSVDPTTAARHRQVVELRIAGRTFDEIAVEVGYAGRQSAKKGYDTALQRWAIEGVEQQRIIQSARLDALWQVTYRAVEAGDLGQVANCLRIEKRRAELWGLDQPKAHHVHVEPPTLTTKTGDMLIKKLEELRERQGPLPEDSDPLANDFPYPASRPNPGPLRAPRSAPPATSRP